MTPDEEAALARRIAGEEIGGQPPRCTGHKADRYNAAYNAVVKAIAALRPKRPEAKKGGCTCQRYPTHQANDCPLHGFDEPTYTAGERVDAGPTPSQPLGAATVERCEALRQAVANILPIGNDRLPDDRVFPIYVRMDELRATHALATPPHQHGACEGNGRG